MTGYEIRELFQTAKERLDIKQVAESYGLQIDRAGKALCPFHTEKTPSFYIRTDKQYFHCFGCGEHGDVFSLAGRLLGIIDKPIDVLKQLNSDFGLGLELDRKQSPEQRRQAEQRQQEITHKKNLERDFEEWVHNSFLTCTRYAKLLREWQALYAPKSEGEPYHPLFEESLLQLARTEYLCDVLTYGNKYDFMDFYKTCRTEVRAIEQRLERYGQRNAG